MKTQKIVSSAPKFEYDPNNSGTVLEGVNKQDSKLGDHPRGSRGGLAQVQTCPPLTPKGGG